MPASLTQKATAIVSTLEDQARTEENFEKLLEIVTNTFGESNPDRASKLTVMYNTLKSRITTYPASTRSYFHNAYIGGYLQHILNVYTNAMAIGNAYHKGGGVVDFTREELVFAALNHDLGKLGSEDADYYVEQTSKWHQDTLGEVFKKNENAPYFSVNDNTFFWLNQFDIKYTRVEFLSIKLADGMYSDESKKYLMNQSPFAIRSALPYLIHWADHMATIIEKGNIIHAINALDE